MFILPLGSIFNNARIIFSLITINMQSTEHVNYEIN